MKNLHYLFLSAFAGLTLVACSDDNTLSNGDTTNPLENIEGSCVKLAIKMPSQSVGTRTTDNDQFADGLASEYAVKDVALIIFQGDSESDATFHSAYDLTDSFTNYTTDGGMSPSGTSNANQISATANLVARTDNKTGVSQTNLYALVVLNRGDILKPNDSHTLTIGSTEYGTASSSLSVADFMKLTASAQSATAASAPLANHVNSFVDATKHIFMANAPVYVKGSESTVGTDEPQGSLKTLVNITEKIYKTQAEAEANPSVDIFVERGVAKVTLENTNTGSAITGTQYQDATNNNTPKYTWSLAGWELDVTNQSSYLVRNMTDGADKTTNTFDTWKSLTSEHWGTRANTNKYRFVGASPLVASTDATVTEAKKWYRTYWAVDPNYSTDASSNLNVRAEDFSAFYGSFGESNPLYCFENTFSTANQKHNATTQIIAKVKVGLNTANASSTAAKSYDGNGSFYTFKNSKTTIYDAANAKAYVANVVLSNEVVKENVLTYLKSLETYKDATISEVSLAVSDASSDVTLGERDSQTGSVEVSGVKVAFNYTPKDGAQTAATVEITDATVLKALNSAVGTITEYEDGYCYYPIRIKHFGDDLTPWSSEYDEVTTDNVYGDKAPEANYLGRYGVLRNNWYDITINSISSIGSAVVPQPGTEWDDEFYNYLSTRCNILTWAKRTQSVDL